MNFFLSFSILAALYYLKEIFTKRKFTGVFEISNVKLQEIEKKYSIVNRIVLVAFAAILVIVIGFCVYSLYSAGYFEIYGV